MLSTKDPTVVNYSYDVMNKSSEIAQIVTPYPKNWTTRITGLAYIVLYPFYHIINYLVSPKKCLM